MGAFKKSLFPMLMVAGLVALFQNCGSNMKGHGNGDPYENLGSANGQISLLPGEAMSYDEGVFAPYLECAAASSSQNIRSLALARNNSSHVLQLKTQSSNRMVLLAWSENQTFASYNRQLDGGVTLINVDFSNSPATAFISVGGSNLTESFNCDSQL